MFSKKSFIVISICIAVFAIGGVWSMQHPKQVTEVLQTVKIANSTPSKETVKKSSSNTNEVKSFATPIQPQTVFNPHHVDFSINAVLREDADKESQTALDVIGTKVPQEFIDHNELIVSYTSMIDQLLPALSDEKRQQLIDGYAMEQYQIALGLKMYYEGKLSWQAMQVASWKTSQQGDNRMQDLLSDEEYLKLKGTSKANSVIGQMPHPYDDLEEKYWKQSEILEQFTVAKATNGAITTEEQLYAYINPDKVAEAMQIRKDLEKKQYFLDEAFKKGDITTEELMKKRNEDWSVGMQKMQDFLTVDEMTILGLGPDDMNK